MTSAALPLSRGAPGTLPRAVDALRLPWSELPPQEGPVRTSATGEKGPGGLEGRLSPPEAPQTFFFFFSITHRPLEMAFSRVSLPGTRSGNQHGRQVIGLKWCLFFPGWGHRERGGEGPGSLCPSHRRPLLETRGYTPLDRVGGGAESTPRPTPPIPNWSPYDGVSEGSGALTFVFLYFFISHTH